MAKIRQVNGIRVGDPIEYIGSFEKFRDIVFIVTRFPNRKSVEAKEKNGIKTISVSIKNIESYY